MSKRRTKNYSNHDISYYHFLHSMQDKIVTVYRGGPESKKGKLVAVKSDYIALQTEKKTIYYQLDHVKSITEDTNNSTTTIETAEMADADDFHSLIGQLMNQSVQLNQGGPESKKGSLVWLGDDYAALNTSEDGVVYFNIHHIKSISKHESALNKEGHTPSVLEADNLNEVFKSLTHKWVSINRGGPEAIEGILVDNADGHYTLVKNQEVLRIYPFHIKSISLGPKGSNNQKKEHDDKEESKNDIDQKQKQEEEGDSNSLTSSKSHSSSSSSKSNKRSSRSSDYQSSTYDRSSDTSSSSKSNKRSSRSSDYQSSTYDRSSDTSSSSKSYRSPRSSDYQSSKYDHSSDTKSSSKSYWSSRSSDYQSSKYDRSSDTKSSSKSYRSSRSSDYQSSKYDRSSDTKSSSKSYRSPRSSDYHSTGSQKEDYSYETIVKTIDYHWKRKF
ncbi:spore coat protein CotH [Bacillus halotolerans]|uniref:spore coat protein CotH n=1 Tax=Bacillus halotolerans TaxID=260554 RepID=UPI000FDC24C7|nr:spore coat protein CotH [Bacillus halotolerans]AZV49841.1 spore coat protein CotH [Bacillus halotolerans]